MLAQQALTSFFSARDFVVPSPIDYLESYMKQMLDMINLLPTLKAALYAPSWEETIRNVKNAQGIYVNHALEVPVCSLRTYFAYRNTVAGLVDEKGYGIDNPFTYMNAYRVSGINNPIRIGLITEPQRLNILYSTQQPDYFCLDRIYAGLINNAPYDLASNTVSDQPWVAQDWEVGT